MIINMEPNGGQNPAAPPNNLSGDSGDNVGR